MHVNLLLQENIRKGPIGGGGGAAAREGKREGIYLSGNRPLPVVVALPEGVDQHRLLELLLELQLLQELLLLGSQVRVRSGETRLDHGGIDGDGGLRGFWGRKHIGIVGVIGEVVLFRAEAAKGAGGCIDGVVGQGHEGGGKGLGLRVLSLSADRGQSTVAVL